MPSPAPPMWRSTRYSSAPRANRADHIQPSVITYRADVSVNGHLFGTRVRSLRDAMNLSLRDLAERSGVSAPMLSQVERGETSPTLAIAARIAAGLELTLSQLLRLDEQHHVVITRRGQGRRR